MGNNDQNNDFIEGLEGEDVELINDLEMKQGKLEVTVHSRDWTVETINSQINQGTIDLNPKFQRRNAWNDKKRSKFIESLILGYPIPEIVLAESIKKKANFIVIDGKQRLLTIAGFINPEKFEYWNVPKLTGLDVLKNLNGLNISDIKQSYLGTARQLYNSDIRSTFITNYKKDDILYDIFYRLNTGSVPLSSQELRQVLNKGNFADYLIKTTNSLQPLHKVLGLKEPDKRLRDIEIIRRFFSLYFFGINYRGNLKKFLDDSMASVTRDWDKYNPKLDDVYSMFNESINKIKTVFGGYKNVGRKYSERKLESRFNRALFEVQAYYFMHIDESKLTPNTKKIFLKEFKKLCVENILFKEAIETTTTSPINIYNRYNEFRIIFNKVFKLNLKTIPVKKQKHA